jgi:hypothetical protein
MMAAEPRVLAIDGDMDGSGRGQRCVHAQGPVSETRGRRSWSWELCSGRVR